MPNTLTNGNLAALVGHAYEPVQTIQSFGYLVAFHKDTGTVEHVSDNIAALLATSVQNVLGQNAANLLGDEIWHALHNTQSVLDGINRRDAVGHFAVRKRRCKLHAFVTGTHIVVEVEPTTQAPALADDFIDTLRFMTDQLQACGTETDLFATATTLLRRATGFEQAIACRIEKDGTGTIIAHAQKPSSDTLLGSHVTLSAQQPLNTGTRIPVQFFADVECEPIKVHAHAPQMKPLDLSQSHVKGMSDTHRKSLEALGVKAMISWPIYDDGDCWGSMAAISKRTSLPSLGLRQILHVVMSSLEAKLMILRQAKTLTMREQVDEIIDIEHSAIVTDKTMDVTLTSLLSRLLVLFEADGAALWAPQTTSKVGQTPDDTYGASVAHRVLSQDDPIICIEHLADNFEHNIETANGPTNCLAIRLPDDRVVLLFRWSYPSKPVWVNVNDPTPSARKNEISGPRNGDTCSEHSALDYVPLWRTQDLLLAKRLWSLVALADQRAALNLMS